ncbi:MAG: hypothetical protein ACYCXO_00900 [Candidatus Humimicrobiaceae bacterium]
MYLQDIQHYIDLYDIFTIEKCLDYYHNIRDGFKKIENTEEFKNFGKGELDKEVHKIASYTINILKAEQYRHKKETIQKWMERDRKEQRKFDNAVPPQKVLCKECFSETKIISKDLHGLYEENSRVLFMFECPNCKKRQAQYEDGTEWHHKTSKCPECDSPLNEKSKFTKNILTTTYSCPNCSYKKEEVDDFNKSDKERKAEKVREKKLLAEYRDEFCVDDKTGQEMLHAYEQLARIMDEMKEKEKKDKDPLIQKARKLKKLTVAQLGKLIEDTIEKEGYKDLKFGKPEMGQYVIIDFTVNETKDDRQESDSIFTLKKLLKSILEDTNWRLMSEGINYRLGILTGRLKAFEKEEDLIKIINSKK